MKEYLKAKQLLGDLSNNPVASQRAIVRTHTSVRKSAEHSQAKAQPSETKRRQQQYKQPAASLKLAVSPRQAATQSTSFPETAQRQSTDTQNNQPVAPTAKPRVRVGSVAPQANRQKHLSTPSQATPKHHAPTVQVSMSPVAERFSESRYEVTSPKISNSDAIINTKINTQDELVKISTTESVASGVIARSKNHDDTTPSSNARNVATEAPIIIDPVLAEEKANSALKSVDDDKNDFNKTELTKPDDESRADKSPKSSLFHRLATMVKGNSEDEVVKNPRENSISADKVLNKKRANGGKARGKVEPSMMGATADHNFSDANDNFDPIFHAASSVESVGNDFNSELTEAVSMAEAKQDTPEVIEIAHAHSQAVDERPISVGSGMSASRRSNNFRRPKAKFRMSRDAPDNIAAENVTTNAEFQPVAPVEVASHQPMDVRIQASDSNEKSESQSRSMKFEQALQERRAKRAETKDSTVDSSNVRHAQVVKRKPAPKTRKSIGILASGKAVFVPIKNTGDLVQTKVVNVVKAQYQKKSQSILDDLKQKVETSKLAALDKIRQNFDLSQPCSGDFDKARLGKDQAYISEHNFKSIVQLSSFAILIMLCLSFTINLWFNREHGYGFRQNVDQDLALINAEIDDIVRANTELEKQIVNYHDDQQAVESMVRFELGMIKPTETFVRIVR